MTEPFPRFRQPRQTDKAYLSWLHLLPCVVTGKSGVGVEAAHVRYADEARGKRHTGKAEKPDDGWALPLWWEKHREQHAMNEREFWKMHGKDPIEICLKLRSFYPDEEAARRFINLQVRRYQR